MPIQAGLLNQFQPADLAGVLATFNPVQANVAGQNIAVNRANAQTQKEQLAAQLRQQLIENQLAQEQFTYSMGQDQIKNAYDQQKLELDAKLQGRQLDIMQQNAQTAEAGLGIQQSQLGISREELGLRREQLKNTIMDNLFGRQLQERQLNATIGQNEVSNDLANRQFEIDAQYKEALMAAQEFSRDPKNPDNLKKLIDIQKSIKDLEAPLSAEGKQAYDIKNNPDLNIAGQVSAGKAPNGYRFSDPTDPNSPLEPIPGGPATKLSPQQAAFQGALTSALGDLKIIKDTLFEGDGTLNRSALFFRHIPYTEGRRADQAMSRALLAKLRLESGAKIGEDELKQYQEIFRIDMGDTYQQAQDKMINFESFLKNTSNIVNSQGKAVLSAGDIQQGLNQGYTIDQIVSFSQEGK